MLVASGKRGRRQGEEYNGRQVEKVIGDGQTGRQLVARGNMFFYFLIYCEHRATGKLVAISSPDVVIFFVFLF